VFGSTWTASTAPPAPARAHGAPSASLHS
jgi:hypothetical protein